MGVTYISGDTLLYWAKLSSMGNIFFGVGGPTTKRPTRPYQNPACGSSSWAPAPGLFIYFGLLIWEWLDTYFPLFLR